MTEILDVVRGAVAGVLGVAVEDVPPQAGLIEEFGLDSLELMEIGTRLENALDLRIDPAALLSAVTAQDVAHYLRGRLATA